jgi:uncharacterized protein (DUF58 family)
VGYRVADVGYRVLLGLRSGLWLGLGLGLALGIELELELELEVRVMVRVKVRVRFRVRVRVRLRSRWRPDVVPSSKRKRNTLTLLRSDSPTYIRYTYTYK